jgi:hypothetical protein
MPLEKSCLGPATDRSIRTAERRLAAADPILKRLIGAHGHYPLATREYAPFHMLANSIIRIYCRASPRPAGLIDRWRRGIRGSRWSGLIDEGCVLLSAAPDVDDFP